MGLGLGLDAKRERRRRVGSLVRHWKRARIGVGGCKRTREGLGVVLGLDA